MTRYVFLSLVTLTLAGCAIPTTQDGFDYTAAVSAGVPLYKRSGASPLTPPTPDDGLCDNCKGKGRLGDGVVTKICPVCNGTGKKPLGGSPAPEDRKEDERGDPLDEGQPRGRSRRWRLFRSP